MKKRSKNVTTKKSGNDKNYATVILFIYNGGNKFPLVLIFKGKSNKNNENTYNKLGLVKNKRILIIFQENAWVNNAIFKKWIDSIYLEYEKILNKKCFLILDKSTISNY